MKKLLLLLCCFSVLACHDDDNWYSRYPDADMYGLKVYAMLLAVHENFNPGVYRHLSMRSSEFRHYNDYHRREVGFSKYVTISGAFIREVSVGGHTDRRVSFGPMTMLPSFSSPYGLSFSHSFPLNGLTSRHTQFTETTGSQLGTNTNFVYYPRSIGFTTFKRAPITLAYFPESDFSGYIPSYSVDPFGAFAVTRRFEPVGGFPALALDTQARIRIHGDVNFFDTLRATIEDDHYEYGTVRIEDMDRSYSEMEFEIYPFPLPI